MTRPLRFGLVGTGHWARITHAPALATTDGIDFAAVWGRNAPAARELADRYHVLAPDLPGFPQCAFGSKGRFTAFGETDLFHHGLPNNSASWDVAGNPLRLVSCAAGRRHLINFLRWIFELRPQSASVLRAQSSAGVR